MTTLQHHARDPYDLSNEDEDHASKDSTKTYRYLFICLMFLNTCCSSPFVLALAVKYAYICFSVHFWKLALRFSAFVDDLGSAGY